MSSFSSYLPFDRDRLAARPAPRSSNALEVLEPRRLFSVSLDDDGWTVVGASDDTRVVDVSSSEGNDDHSGLSAQSPLRSISKAAGLLRDGHADWLLLKSGDTFHGGFPTWRKSGRSADEPMLIGRYGEGPRPLLMTGSGSGFRTDRAPVNHLALIGLEFYAHERDPRSGDFAPAALADEGAYGLHVLSPSTDLLVEDVRFRSYQNNLAVQSFYGQVRDFTLRRSVLADATWGNGAYFSEVDGVLIEESVFDHNGWTDARYGHDERPGHNLYLQSNNLRVVVRGNVFADAGSHGVQARAGGIIEDNLFVNNPIGLSFGFVNGGAVKPGGVAGRVTGNVFLGGRDIAGAARGWAMEIGNTAVGADVTVADNVIAHDSQHAFAAIRLGYGHTVSNEDQAVGINDLRVERNVVYGWHRAVSTGGSLAAGQAGHRSFNNVRVTDNDFQAITSDLVVDHGAPVSSATETWRGNRYDVDGGGDHRAFASGGATLSLSDWRRAVEPTATGERVDYFAPDRSIETYNAALGGRPSAEPFLHQATLQSRDNWREQYTAESVIRYVRAGFGKTDGPPRLVATNLSSRNLQPARKRMQFYFNQDVSGSLSVDDLVLKSKDSGRIIEPDEMELAYDAVTNLATFTFPGVKRGMLPAGTWYVTLKSDGITGTDGESALDGDFDGLPGEDYKLRIKIKAAV